MMQDISQVPAKPGVYLFKGQKEKILYVGKAKNLRNRLRTYFHNTSSLDNRKAAMVRMVKDFSYVVTNNEFEALIVESKYIKQYRPRFNIVLRDDKNYPYLKLTITEEWPKIEVVRRVKNDGDLYFGPYVASQAMWENLSFIRRTFSIRTCRHALDNPVRPCIQHQMKRCIAPCTGAVSRDEYMKAVEEVRLFLLNDKKRLIENLNTKMERLSYDMRFEEAAKVRDRLMKLQRAFESQKVIAPEIGDADVIGFYKEVSGLSCEVSFHILFLRNSMLIGEKDFFIERVMTNEDAEIMHSFIELFYTKEIIPPPVILMNTIPSENKALLALLRNNRSDAVVFEIPKEGKKADLLSMANENALISFRKRTKSPDEVLDAIAKKLDIRQQLSCIGAFDVSTIQGSASVGAFICWDKGDFNKECYRHMKIKGVVGVDDYAMMKEIVQRTLSKPGSAMPDLIIIDGGKGQLDAAQKAVGEMGVEVEMISIAKKPDRAFLPDGRVIDLQDRSRESLLLRKIRDEAHRFAIGFHRKLRDKRLMESQLEKIPGIGTKRRLALLRHFGSLDAIRAASVDDIMQLKGFSKAIAERLVKGIKD